MQLRYQQIPTCTLKVDYTYSESLRISDEHMVIFKEKKNTKIRYIKSVKLNYKILGPIECVITIIWINRLKVPKY